MTWVLRVIGALGLLVVAWCCVTAWPAIVHGHPLYAILIILTVGLSVFAIVKSFRARGEMRMWRRVLGIIGVVLFAAWIAAMAWLVPSLRWSQRWRPWSRHRRSLSPRRPRRSP